MENTNEANNSTDSMSRKIYLRQDQQASGGKSKLGFSLRGGKEATGNSVGVFVCHVEFGSEAQKGGLKIGDQLLEVNRQPVERATYEQVIQWIRLTPPAQQIELQVRNLGRIPVQTKSGDPIRWLIVAEEPSSLLPSEPNESLSTPNSSGDEGIELCSRSLELQASSIESSLACSSSPDATTQEDDGQMIERVMLIRVPGKRSATTNTLKQQQEQLRGDYVEVVASFGCEVVRGPSEWPPGVYVQTVAPNSLAERVGLEPGDELLEAQEQSLNEIPFEDAVKLIKRLQNEESELRLMVRKGAALNCLRRLRHLQQQQLHLSSSSYPRKSLESGQQETKQAEGEEIAIDKTTTSCVAKTRAIATIANGSQLPRVASDAAANEADKSISGTENQLSGNGPNASNYSNQFQLKRLKQQLNKQAQPLSLHEVAREPPLESNNGNNSQEAFSDTWPNEQISALDLGKGQPKVAKVNGENKKNLDADEHLDENEAKLGRLKKPRSKLDAAAAARDKSNGSPATLQLTSGSSARQTIMNTCHKSTASSSKPNNESNATSKQELQLQLQEESSSISSIGKMQVNYTNNSSCCCNMKSHPNSKLQFNTLDGLDHLSPTQSQVQVQMQMQPQMTQMTQIQMQNTQSNSRIYCNNYSTDQANSNDDSTRIKIVKSSHCKFHNLQKQHQQAQVQAAAEPSQQLVQNQLKSQLNQHPQFYPTSSSASHQAFQQKSAVHIMQQPIKISCTSKLHDSSQQMLNVRRQRQISHQQQQAQSYTMQRYMSMDNISLQLNPYTSPIQAQLHSSRSAAYNSKLADRGQLLMIAAGNMHHQHKQQQQQQQQQQQMSINANLNAKSLLNREQQLQKQLAMRQQEAAYCVAALHREQQLNQSRQMTLNQYRQQQMNVASNRVFISRPRTGQRECFAYNHYNTAPSPAARLSKAKSMDKLNFCTNDNSQVPLATATATPSSRHSRVEQAAVTNRLARCCATSPPMRNVRTSIGKNCSICAAENSDKIHYLKQLQQSRMVAQIHDSKRAIVSDCCTNQQRLNRGEQLSLHRLAGDLKKTPSFDCAACAAHQVRINANRTQNESANTVIRLVSGKSAGIGQKRMTTFHGSQAKSKQQHQRDQLASGFHNQYQSQHSRNSSRMNLGGGGSDQMSPICTPPQLSSDCGDEDSDCADNRLRMRQSSSPSVSVSSISSTNLSSRSLNSLDEDSGDSFAELKSQGKQLEKISSAKSVNKLIASSSKQAQSPSHIPNAPPCPPMATLLNDAPVAKQNNANSKSCNEKLLVSNRQHQRQSMCFLDELKSLARQSTTSGDSGIANSTGGAPKNNTNSTDECDSRTLIKMINASKMLSRASAAPATRRIGPAGSSSNNCAHCAQSGKNLTTNVTISKQQHQSKSNVILCRKCRNDELANKTSSAQTNKQMLISGNCSNSSSSAISSAASTISYTSEASSGRQSNNANNNSSAPEVGSSRTQSANNIISQADKQRLQHEMLMKEFKSVHSRMFGNKQPKAINSSGESAKGDAASIKTRPDMTREQQPLIGHKLAQSDRGDVGSTKIARTRRNNESDADSSDDHDDNNTIDNHQQKLHLKSSGKPLQNARARPLKQPQSTTFNGQNHGHEYHQRKLAAVS